MLKHLMPVIMMLVVAMTSGCATLSEVGEGLFVGGSGSGSSGLAALGIITENVGRIAAQPSKGSPEFEARKRDVIESHVQLVFRNRFGKILNANLETTPAQITQSAKEYCAEIDRIAQAKENIELSRKYMNAMYIDDKFLPDGDNEIIPYQVTVNPFGSKCVAELESTGYNVMTRLKQQAGKR